MPEAPRLPSRSEAVRTGLSWYGEIHDTYRMDGVTRGTLGLDSIGVSVHILSVEDRHPIDITWLERSSFRFNRTYERAIRKETIRAADKIIRLSGFQPAED